MTSFLAFILFFFFVQKHSCLYNKKKVTRRLKIQILFSCVRKQYFYLLAVLFRKLLFLPLENKTHIFALASLRSFVKYCFYHSKIKLISSGWRCCGDILYIFCFVSCHGSSLKQSLDRFTEGMVCWTGGTCSDDDLPFLYSPVKVLFLLEGVLVP